MGAKTVGSISVALAAVLLHIVWQKRAVVDCIRRIDANAQDSSLDEAAAAAVAVYSRTDAPRRPPTSRLARAYVINVGSARNRWDIMEETLGHLFSGLGGLPRWRRFDAATPIRDGCDLPYSMHDCCTRSHMNVLLNFSRDDEVREDQWVLVLEDDVAIHPSVPPHLFGDIIEAGLAEAEKQSSPFVYLGLCSPTCTGQEYIVSADRGAMVSFRTKCGGFCTHAYAVQKFIAPRVPEYLKLVDYKERTVDQAFNRMAPSLNMSLLGGSLKSRDPRAAGSIHVGLFYMKAFSDSLTTGAWEAAPQVIFRLAEWSGRIGNLMFEWAAVAGLAHTAGVESQAYFDVMNFKDSARCPAGSFFRTFRLGRFTRDEMHIPRKMPLCELRLDEIGANLYDEAQVNKLLADIRSYQAKKKKCKTIEVIISGYLQSWKYFRGYEDKIRIAFGAPPEQKRKAEAWLAGQKSRLSEKFPGVEWRFVGVQVRRGDKVHQSLFASIYAPTDWPYYKAGMRHLEAKLSAGQANVKVAFVITAGGSMGSNSKDVLETKQGLSGAAGRDNLLFAEGTDPITDFALLTSTDALIVSASSFGWWAGFASTPGKSEGLVVAPRYIYRPAADLSKGYREHDYYPPNWKIIDNIELESKDGK